MAAAWSLSEGLLADDCLHLQAGSNSSHDHGRGALLDTGPHLHFQSAHNPHQQERHHATDGLRSSPGAMASSKATPFSFAAPAAAPAGPCAACGAACTAGMCAACGAMCSLDLDTTPPMLLDASMQQLRLNSYTPGASLRTAAGAAMQPAANLATGTAPQQQQQQEADSHVPFIPGMGLVRTRTQHGTAQHGLAPATSPMQRAASANSSYTSSSLPSMPSAVPSFATYLRRPTSQLEGSHSTATGISVLPSSSLTPAASNATALHSVPSTAAQEELHRMPSMPSMPSSDPSMPSTEPSAPSMAAAQEQQLLLLPPEPGAQGRSSFTLPGSGDSQARLAGEGGLLRAGVDGSASRAGDSYSSQTPMVPPSPAASMEPNQAESWNVFARRLRSGSLQRLSSTRVHPTLSQVESVGRMSWEEHTSVMMDDGVAPLADLQDGWQLYDQLWTSTPASPLPHSASQQQLRSHLTTSFPSGSLNSLLPNFGTGSLPGLLPKGSPHVMGSLGNAQLGGPMLGSLGSAQLGSAGSGELSGPGAASPPPGRHFVTAPGFLPAALEEQQGAPLRGASPGPDSQEHYLLPSPSRQQQQQALLRAPKPGPGTWFPISPHGNPPLAHSNSGGSGTGLPARTVSAVSQPDLTHRISASGMGSRGGVTPWYRSSVTPRTPPAGSSGVSSSGISSSGFGRRSGFSGFGASNDTSADGTASSTSPRHFLASPMRLLLSMEQRPAAPRSAHAVGAGVSEWHDSVLPGMKPSGSEGALDLLLQDGTRELYHAAHSRRSFEQYSSDGRGGGDGGISSGNNAVDVVSLLEEAESAHRVALGAALLDAPNPTVGTLLLQPTDEVQQATFQQAASSREQQRSHSGRLAKAGSSCSCDGGALVRVGSGPTTVSGGFLSAARPGSCLPALGASVVRHGAAAVAAHYAASHHQQHQQQQQQQHEHQQLLRRQWEARLSGSGMRGTLGALTEPAMGYQHSGLGAGSPRRAGAGLGSGSPGKPHRARGGLFGRMRHVYSTPALDVLVESQQEGPLPETTHLGNSHVVLEPAGRNHTGLATSLDGASGRMPSVADLADEGEVSGSGSGSGSRAHVTASSMSVVSEEREGQEGRPASSLGMSMAGPGSSGSVATAGAAEPHPITGTGTSRFQSEAASTLQHHHHAPAGSFGGAAGAVPAYSVLMYGRGSTPGRLQSLPRVDSAEEADGVSGPLADLLFAEMQGQQPQQAPPVVQQ